MTEDSAAGFAKTARDQNLFETDTNLRRLLERRAPKLLKRHGERLSAFGAWAGGPLDRQAEYTDRFAPPKLDAYAGDGSRAGRVVFNSDYLECHAEAYRRGAVGLPWAEGGDGSHVPCFVMGYLLSHADISIHCPVTMTGAVAYVLDTLAPAEIKAKYLPELIRMDGKALSGGTWATELHGGSDVGATTTTAEQRNDGWRLNGLKWFTSNAGSGLALATARPGAEPGSKGLGCYLVPSHLEDGSPNAYRVRRLKEKAGTRGLATAELDLEGCFAEEVAPPPDGLKTMMAALEYSRIHNAVGAAGLHRRAFLEAAGWASHRVAFGRTIRHYPMVQDQLLDMQMQLEAGVALAFESVFAFEAHRSKPSPQTETWLRVATALAKYRTAEHAVRACREAVEIVGGNGYTEEWPTARLYRDCLVTAVWEGPANIQALELLRLIPGKRRGDSAFLQRIDSIWRAMPDGGQVPGGSEGMTILGGLIDNCSTALMTVRAMPADAPRIARKVMELMADTLAAALLVEEATADWKRGDIRKWLVASRFLHHLAGYDRVIPSNAHRSTAAFDEVLAGRPVSV